MPAGCIAKCIHCIQSAINLYIVSMHKYTIHVDRYIMYNVFKYTSSLVI